MKQPDVTAVAREVRPDSPGLVAQPAGSPQQPVPDTMRMQKISLEAVARQQLQRAADAGGGHAADTVYGGHEKVLRQTVIGMNQGARLAEHENPGEATVQVLRGRVRMSAGEVSWEARTGDLLIVPDSRHSLEATEDSVVLLTVAKLP
jgi:quercetin dioxygenase-like cupin family protein